MRLWLLISLSVFAWPASGATKGDEVIWYYLHYQCIAGQTLTGDSITPAQQSDACGQRDALSPKLEAAGMCLDTAKQKWAACAANWCMKDDGCVGYIPISGNEFHTCEETCTKSNATPVRGLDATLYDVSCKGDWGGYDYTMIMGEYEDAEEQTHGYIVTPNGTEALEICQN